jgi:hypothetical protein
MNYKPIQIKAELRPSGVGWDLAKSTIRTVRIDEDLNEAMERLALEGNTSVNFLVNNALREHVEWTSIIPKLGFGTYPRYLTTTLFEKLTDKECEETGERVAREFLKPFVEYRFGSISLENWIQMTRDFSKYSGQYQFLMERKKDGEIIIILEHGSGIKVSHFFAGAGHYIYRESLGKAVETEISDSKCTVRVR